MRLLQNKERTQRGCIYCTESTPQDTDEKQIRRKYCPHNKCPYHELDDVKSYTEYLKRISDVPLGTLLVCLGKAK